VGKTKPYRRTVRIFTNNTYSDSGRWMYVLHKNYADSPANFVRAFLLIQKDVLELFDYIEPSDTNLSTHSHRIHELLLRTCVEIEANCTAILRENGYVRDGNWNMGDYKKIELSHYLSQYEVKVPNWLGSSGVRSPFSSWASSGSLAWYTAYNLTKHDRHLNFIHAKFENLIDAVTGLSALLASQFLNNDFSPAGMGLSVNPGGPCDGFEPSIGGFFLLKFPNNVPDTEKYDFSRSDIDFDNDIFENFKYI
jgi:hypothetical protein